jgi:hypothetical protein
MPAAAPESIGADFDYRPAWRRDDAAIEADAIAFWQRLNILPAGIAPEARAKELAAAAYKDGRLVGVSTATLGVHENLRARFAWLRAAVDPAYRRTRAAFGLALYTRDVIERWALEHPQERVAGLAAIIESPDLAAREKEPWWPTTRFGLVGYNAAGRQVRVSWFEDYRLD